MANKPDRKSRSVVFRFPTGASLKDIKTSVEKELGSACVIVLQELRAQEYLVEFSNAEQAERIIADGFDFNGLHVQPSPPVGQFTNVSIMGLRAYVEDTIVEEALSKYGELRSDIIRLKYKKGHDLEGLENGNRLVKMVLTSKSIPYSIKIDGEWCRIIHSNQKPVCNFCLEEGHRRSQCPEIECFKCGKKGHLRAHCTEISTIDDTPTPDDNLEANPEPIIPTNDIELSYDDSSDDEEDHLDYSFNKPDTLPKTATVTDAAKTQPKPPPAPKPSCTTTKSTPQPLNTCNPSTPSTEMENGSSLSSTNTLKRDRNKPLDSSSDDDNRKRRPRLNPKPAIPTRSTKTTFDK